MKVLKFGGTSVGNPQRMQQVAKLVAKEESCIVVLSAVSGTTNALVEIADAYTNGKKEDAQKLIGTLEKFYQQFISKLYSTVEMQNFASLHVKSHFAYLRNFADDVFTPHEERNILAQGELISTALFHFYLEETGVKATLLPALDFMRIDESSEPDETYIKENLRHEINKHPDEKLFITQGYICRNAFGEIDNLKRGGSDYSASLIGAALRCDEIQIWTDIDGMHNNDPRYVSNTHTVSNLSFDEAAELAYFGAKILHPQSILPARKYNIPVRLLNTMDPGAKGTLITERSEGNTIKAVAAKDGIIAIKIKSGRMLLAYGFLRNVFEIFELYKTPIDMITTSEVAVSLTIDNKENLNEIIADLKQLGTVEVDYEQTIVCVVGDFLEDKPGFALRVFEAMKNIPLRMISYGGSKNNISFLINKAFKKDALNALHVGLF